MSQIAQITAQADGSFMVTDVTVVGTPSKSLEKNLADGSKSEYCLINCSYKAVDKKTGEIVTRTLAGSRGMNKSMPEKGSEVAVYGRIVEDARGKTVFYSIATSVSSDINDLLADLEEHATVAPKGTLAPVID